MRTATYHVDVASDRRRRENVPRHILCSFSLSFFVRCGRIETMKHTCGISCTWIHERMFKHRDRESEILGVHEKDER